MTVKARALFLLAVWCSGQTTLSAASSPLELKWTELAPMITTHTVELTLRDGGSVSGEAIAVREDTLLLDVTKSSGTPQSKQYANGNATIPRSAITLIALQRSRGAWGRTVGTTLGVIIGLGIGGDAAYHTDSGGKAVAVLLGVGSGIALVGYYTGRQLDKRTTRIKITP